MKNFAFLALILLTSIGCSTTERYANNNRAGEAWLAQNAGRAQVTAAGSYSSQEWGGGEIRFDQKGNAVSGVMGDYSVRGVLNGSRLYVLLHTGGWNYYTAVLRKTGSSFVGFYSPSVPFTSADQSPVTLRRIEN